VTFNRRGSGSLSPQAIREQALTLGLHAYARIIGLGGAEYRRVLKEAPVRLGPRLDFPFGGTRLGEALRATKLAAQETTPKGDPKVTK